MKHILTLLCLVTSCISFTNLSFAKTLLVIDNNIFLPRYDNYPTHCSNDFLDPKTNHCRIAKVEPGNRKGLGAASLNLTNIQEQDRGWYNCKVVLLNRQPEKENDVSF